MGWEDLTYRDKLAGKHLAGTRMGARSIQNWMGDYKVTLENGKYKWGGTDYGSLNDVMKAVYKDNDSFNNYTHYKQNQGEYFKSAMDNLPSGFGSSIGGMFADFGSSLRRYDHDDFSESQKATQSLIRGGLNAIPMFGPGIAAVTGVVDMIGSMSGLNLSNIDKNAAERADIEGSATASEIINSLPGVSALAGLFAKRTNSFTKSDLIDNLGGAFSKSMGDIDAATSLSEKRIYDSDKANTFIAKADDTQNTLIGINDESRTRLKGVTHETMNDLNKNRSLKYQGSSNFSIGRHGMKLMSIQEVNRILNLRKSSNIQEFKNGGVIGIDSNIIPEGKLHAHKHHLNDSNPDLEDVTKKGIPVVTVDSEGELQQVAEIEREEIIFRKEVTNQLEQLYKDGSDDAMIKAGILIAHELMTNTDDKTEEFLNE